MKLQNTLLTSTADSISSICDSGSSSSVPIYSNVSPSFVYSSPNQYYSLEDRIKDFLEHFPIIYTITSVSYITSNPRLLHITYDNSCDAFKSRPEGTVYINECQKYAVWERSNNRYWYNSLILEFEEDIENIKGGSKFIIMNQWDDKFTNTELIEMLNNPLTYYNKAHLYLEEILSDKYNIVECHQKLDDMLKLKEIYE